MTKEQKLLPRMATAYWDMKFQMERQAEQIKKDFAGIRAYYEAVVKNRKRTK